MVRFVIVMSTRGYSFKVSRSRDIRQADRLPSMISSSSSTIPRPPERRVLKKQEKKVVRKSRDCHYLPGVLTMQRVW